MTELPLVPALSTTKMPLLSGVMKVRTSVEIRQMMPVGSGDSSNGARPQGADMELKTELDDGLDPSQFGHVAKLL